MCTNQQKRAENLEYQIGFMHNLILLKCCVNLSIVNGKSVYNRLGSKVRKKMWPELLSRRELAEPFYHKAMWILPRVPWLDMKSVTLPEWRLEKQGSEEISKIGFFWMPKCLFGVLATVRQSFFWWNLRRNIMVYAPTSENPEEEIGNS